MANPVEGNAEAVARGSLLFRARCAGCHGLDAKGVSGPDLTAALAGMSDERFFRTVRSGQGTEMPRFGSEQTSDVQVWEILAHLRGWPAVKRPRPSNGNAANGARIFQARCAGCHRVDGKGGALGPDLTRIGATRSPSALAAQGSRSRTSCPCRATGRSLWCSATAGGFAASIKNEDAFSIQIMDLSERIQGFPKRDLREIVRETALADAGVRCRAVERCRPQRSGEPSARRCAERGRLRVP